MITRLQRDEIYQLAANWCQANADYFAGEGNEANQKRVQETGDAFAAALDALVSDRR